MADEERKPDRLWALFDNEWAYKGGIVAEEQPGETENPEGYQVLEVTRFPMLYEQWDPTHKAWVIDEAKKAASEKEVEMLRATRPELAEMIQSAIQEWLLNVLPEIVPGLRISEEQRARYFPLTGRK
jgi:hypothetical protein